MKLKHTIPLSLLMAFSLTASPAPRDEYAISASELALLPKFCRYLSPGNFRPEARHLAMKGRAPGEHAHHFCHGMKYLIRARRALGDKQARKEALQRALGEFSYVEEHTKNPRGMLLPYVALYKGEAFDQLGRRQEALHAYLKAVKLNPKLSRAYAKLADLFVALDQKEKAVKVLRYGIKKTRSKSLVRRLKQLQKQ